MSELIITKVKKLLVIDCSATDIKIVYLESMAKGVEILAADSKKISAATLQDQTRIIDDFIHVFLQENSVVTKNVVINVSTEESIFIKPVTLPSIPESEILNAAKWQLKEDMPFDIESALIDWQVIKEHVDHDGVKQNIFLFAVAREEVIKNYLDMLAPFKFDILAVTTTVFSYENLFRAFPAERPAAIAAVLDIEQEYSTLSIYKNHHLALVRKLPLSWDKFTQALREVFVLEQEKIQLSIEEAETIKNTIGVPEDLSVRVKDHIYAIHIFTLIRPLLESLLRDMKLSFHYFRTNIEEETPALVYLGGYGARLKNLAKYLSRELGVSVQPFPLPEGIKAKMKNEEWFQSNRLALMGTLGAGLIDANSVNFLPDEIRLKKETRRQNAFWVLMVGLGVIGILFFFLMMQNQIFEYEDRLNNVQGNLSTVEEIKKLQAKIQRREALLDQVQKNTIPVHGLLKIISQLIPEDIVLSELRFDQDAHSLLLKGTASLGQERSQSLLTNFMEKLELSSFINEADLVSSRQTQGEEEFEIKCDIVRDVSDERK